VAVVAETHLDEEDIDRGRERGERGEGAEEGGTGGRTNKIR